MTAGTSGADGPRVAVVVPVRDDPHGVATCLAALADQERPAAEIVVVDDGSRPPLTLPSGAPPCARLIRVPAGGSYAARNAAVAVIEADVVAFTDADCRPDPGWLAAAVARLVGDPGAGAVAGRIEVVTEARPNVVERYDRHRAFPQRYYVEAHGFGVTANLVVRREALEAAGAFDGRLVSGGDYEWCQRLRATRWRLVYEDEAVVRHPARGTLRSLLRKRRRVAAGVEQLRARGQYPRGHRLLRQVASRVAGVVIGVARLLTDRRLPFLDRVRFAVVLVLERSVEIHAILGSRRRRRTRSAGSV